MEAADHCHFLGCSWKTRIRLSKKKKKKHLRKNTKRKRRKKLNIAAANLIMRRDRLLFRASNHSNSLFKLVFKADFASKWMDWIDCSLKWTEKKRSLLRIGQRQFENLGAQRGLRDFDTHVTCSRQKRQRETSGNLPNVHV